MIQSVKIAHPQWDKGVRMKRINKANLFTKMMLLLSGCLAVVSGLSAEIRLPNILGDHMVIQQQKPIRIWGWAIPKEQINLIFETHKIQTSADEKGQWEVTLEPMKADGQPKQMIIEGFLSQTVVLTDILLGEVWVCSGQSNMQWSMLQTQSPTPEIQRADHPQLRLYYVPRKFSTIPLEDIEADWEICSPETVGPFSAVAYYFGREIHLELNVPVGLIHSSWGGTRIEPWIPDSGFESVPELDSYLKEKDKLEDTYLIQLQKSLPEFEVWIRAAKKSLETGDYIHPQPDMPAHPHANNRTPEVLFNAMIHPLIRFSIRGAIWYQGEANRNDGSLYTKKMKALINGWRTEWNGDDFPFYYVQLAPFNYAYSSPNDESDIPDFERLPRIWEAQFEAMKIPNTGMAVVSDITNLNDIHPRNKKDVGFRLALWALAKTYGKNDLVYSGPLYKSMSIQGDKIRIQFDHIGSGLISLNNSPLTWFEIAGENRVFYKAHAEIKGDSVLVWNERIEEPIAVRFGWHQLAVPNLGNKEGLPASPFRTHRW
jgi:sialate O-acetylesterase